MKKIIIFTATIFTFCSASYTTAFSQKWKPGFTIGGNLLYAKPSGKFANAYNFGGGGEVFGGMGLGKTYLIATAGAAAFKPDGDQGTLTYLPLKIGVKHYLLLNKIFVNGDIGTASVKARGLQSKRFTRGIGAGVRFLGLEAGLYYDGWKNENTSGYSNSLNAKVGWSFKL
ncbi:MAG: hypothetical protein JWQ96_582 [Segetibacter sp.]|nr:hypothetical protein [Segetibacter sp.]